MAERRCTQCEFLIMPYERDYDGRCADCTQGYPSFMGVSIEGVRKQNAARLAAETKAGAEP